MTSPNDSPTSTVAATVLTLNQREKPLQCLSHIQNIPGAPHKIAVWDNGSTNATARLCTQDFLRLSC
jgi:GT2 family glycosyltransferase